MVDGIDDQGVYLVMKLVNDPALFIDAEPAYAAPNDLEAIGRIGLCGFLHCQQNVIKEMNAFRCYEYP